MEMKAITCFMSVTLLLVSVFLTNTSVEVTHFDKEPESFAAQSSVDWWPMFHHDPTHAGHSNSTAITRPEILWTCPIDVMASSPAVVDGRVYVGSWKSSVNGTVYALDASTGTPMWNYNTTGAIRWSSPAVVGGVVYIGTVNGTVYALDAENGSKIWDYTTGDHVESSPTVVDGVVYIGSFDHNVYALNASTGTQIWNYTTGGIVESSPAVVGNVVYVGSRDNIVYAINASTGLEEWSYPTHGWVDSSPAVVDGRVYVGSEDNKVYALNASNGAPKWSYPTHGWVDSSPAVVDGRVYVSSENGLVYALNASTSTQIWNYTISSAGYVGQSSPAVAGGVVYVGSSYNDFYALNASTGAYIWNLALHMFSSPAIADGVVYVSSGDGKVYAIGTHVFVSISPASVVMDAGQYQLFTSTVTEGIPPYSYEWYLNTSYIHNMQMGVDPTLNFTYPIEESCSLLVKVTDGVGAQQKSNIATVTVNPKLWVTIAPASAIMEVGQSQLFTSHLIGGTSPYAYQWYLNDSVVSGADGSTWNFTLSSEGPCRVSVKVTDGVGAQQKSNTAPVNTHNVAITDVWSYKTTVGQNFSAHIGVNVTDLGSYPEIFIVTAYADTTSIAAQNITLSALGSTIMTLTWNTTGFVKGNYTISAYAQPVLGETDTTDNTHVNGKALVTIKGDVVPEFGTVDIYDLISVATSFGTSSGEPNFKSNADINSDNTIDIYDIIIVATHYGETDP